MTVTAAVAMHHPLLNERRLEIAVDQVLEVIVFVICTHNEICLSSDDAPFASNKKNKDGMIQESLTEVGFSRLVPLCFI